MDALEGKVLAKFGDDVSTDDMTSGKYVRSTKPEELAKICMKDIDPEFPQKVAAGGFLVAGKNFGCGSSREWAPVALKAAGVRAVLAEECARIFYRNAINVGLPVVECPDASSRLDLGDQLEVNLTTGMVRNVTAGITLQGIPIPGFLLERMRAGGLAAYLKQRLHAKRISKG